MHLMTTNYLEHLNVLMQAWLTEIFQLHSMRAIATVRAIGNFFLFFPYTYKKLINWMSDSVPETLNPSSITYFKK